MKSVPLHPDGCSDTRRLRRTWGELLGRYDWTHAATLTFRHATSGQNAMRESRRFIRRLEQRSEGAVAWFVAAEETYPGAAHLHAALRVQNLSTPAIKSAWTAGISQINQYGRHRGWAYYMSKRIGSDALDYDIHVKSPPQERG